jgi:hypothetical protein
MFESLESSSLPPSPVLQPSTESTAIGIPGAIVGYLFGYGTKD